MAVDQATIDQMQAEAAAGEQPLPAAPFSVPNSGPGAPSSVAAPPAPPVGPEGSLGPTPTPQNAYQGIGGVMPNAPVDALGNPKGMAVEPPPPQAPPLGAGSQPPPHAPPQQQGPSLDEREAQDLFNRADPTGKLRNGPGGGGNSKLLNEAEQLRDRERVMNSRHAYAEKARQEEISAAVNLQARQAEQHVSEQQEKLLAFQNKLAADQDRYHKWEAEQKKDVDPTRALQLNTTHGVGGAIADGAGKLMLVLAAALGGYANKGTNPGLAAIDNMIKNDIDAQKAEIQNAQAVGARKQNEFSQALDYFKNSTVAENALYAHKADAIKLAVDAMKEKNSGSKIVESAEALNLGIDQKANEARQKLAAAQAAAAQAWTDKIHANFHQAREERRQDFQAQTARMAVDNAGAAASAREGAANDKATVNVPGMGPVVIHDPKERYKINAGLEATELWAKIAKDAESIRGGNFSVGQSVFKSKDEALNALQTQIEFATQASESSISGTPARLTEKLGESAVKLGGNPHDWLNHTPQLALGEARKAQQRVESGLARSKLAPRQAPASEPDVKEEE